MGAKGDRRDRKPQDLMIMVVRVKMPKTHSPTLFSSPKERKTAYSYVMHNVKFRPRVCCGRRWEAAALFFVASFA
jgi:hypothetical protein